ncbi:MAG: flagellar motor stator protein MotA [Sulfurospirillaceae bacterium]|nr:flagellar motor stator protein MotA [Sulfurospirillaceae bacterium]
MDLTVILGMLISVACIAIGDLMEGGNPLHVLHITSFIIVIPTALASAMTGTSSEYVRAAFKEFKVIFKKSPINLRGRISQIIDFAVIARRDGILALETHANQMDDEFFKKGLSMAVDGIEAHEIEETLEILIEETEEYYHGAAHYWLLAGESCPVIGLIGAVLGLILALQKLDNPAEMAAGIAGAFTATVTGIAGAYIFMGPWGNKLKSKSKYIIKEKSIILAGILGISHGDNPRTLEAKLLNYLSLAEEKKSQFEK